MEALQEALKSVRILDDDNSKSPTEDKLGDDIDFDLDGSAEDDSQDPADDADNSTDGQVDSESEFDLEGNGDEESDESPEEQSELNTVATQATEDPDRRGLIRTVKDAHLVYKRETEDGTFEELWVFNVTDLKREMTIRKAILAGTDIEVNKSSSPDEKQEYTIWTAGNVEMLKITGLPS